LLDNLKSAAAQSMVIKVAGATINWSFPACHDGSNDNPANVPNFSDSLSADY
jgi:hypothetical protein